MELGRLDEAAEHYRKAIDRGEELTKVFPSEPRYRVRLLVDYNGLGNLLYSLGEWEEAARRHLQELDLAKQLRRDSRTMLVIRPMWLGPCTTGP